MYMCYLRVHNCIIHYSKCFEHTHNILHIYVHACTQIGITITKLSVPSAQQAQHASNSLYYNKHCTELIMWYISVHNLDSLQYEDSVIHCTCPLCSSLAAGTVISSMFSTVHITLINHDSK